jgi:hypothetical protein
MSDPLDQSYPSIIETVAPDAIPPCDYVLRHAYGRGEPCGRPAVGFVDRELNGEKFCLYTCRKHALSAARPTPGKILAIGVIEVRWAATPT